MAVQWPTGKVPARRANRPENKKGRPEPPWFLPITAVPRDETPPSRVRSSSMRK